MEKEDFAEVKKLKGLLKEFGEAAEIASVELKRLKAIERHNKMAQELIDIYMNQAIDLDEITCESIINSYLRIKRVLNYSKILK